MSSLSPKRKKNIVICNFPRFSGEIWLPFLWATAKTFYELYGRRVDEWNWYPCNADVYSIEYEAEIKELLKDSNPDVFAISLYVWNYTIAHRIAAWVKEQWPNCIIISGGPHQYFKHDMQWFKEYPHLDASLPGDCYGEQCFMEILDNYNDATATVDWKKVTDIYYPSKSRIVLSNPKSMSKSERKVYPFDWSAMSAQFDHLIEFAKFQREKFPDSFLLSVLETTRGCPYGCTYCDWGGGVNTNVLKKSLLSVKQDIDALLNIDLMYLYVADANFGIFGDRDLSIVEYIACRRYELRQNFYIGYGGYAKTENKLEYIKKIIATDILFRLSATSELKLSMQTLDDQILDNIDRKNIPLDKQLGIYQELAKNKKLPLYVELIMGLPGMTLDKYYHELEILGSHNLSVQWFEWILLPETPAYSREYRERFGIKTIIKNKGWAVPEDASNREVVIASNSMSDRDYMQMILSNSLYHLFVLGGYYNYAINWVKTNCNVGLGQLVRTIYEDFFDDSDAYVDWQKVMTDPDALCTFNVCGEQIYGSYYFVAKVLLDQTFANKLAEFLQRKYDIPQDIMDSDLEINITAGNFGLEKWKGLYKITYKTDTKFLIDGVHAIIGTFRSYAESGRIMQGKKKLLGLFDVDN